MQKNVTFSRKSETSTLNRKPHRCTKTDFLPSCGTERPSGPPLAKGKFKFLQFLAVVGPMRCPSHHLPRKQRRKARPRNSSFALPCSAAPPIISIWPWLIRLFPLSLLEGRSRRVEYVNTRRRTSTPEADDDDVLDVARAIRGGVRWVSECGQCAVNILGR